MSLLSMGRGALLLSALFPSTAPVFAETAQQSDAAYLVDVNELSRNMALGALAGQTHLPIAASAQSFLENITGEAAHCAVETLDGASLLMADLSVGQRPCFPGASITLAHEYRATPES